MNVYIVKWLIGSAHEYVGVDGIAWVMWGLLGVITCDSGQFEFDCGSVQTQVFI